MSCSFTFADTSVIILTAKIATIILLVVSYGVASYKIVRYIHEERKLNDEYHRYSLPFMDIEFASKYYRSSFGAILDRKILDYISLVRSPALGAAGGSALIWFGLSLLASSNIILSASGLFWIVVGFQVIYGVFGLVKISVSYPKASHIEKMREAVRDAREAAEIDAASTSAGPASHDLSAGPTSSYRPDVTK